jgi:hypothetical protein
MMEPVSMAMNTPNILKAMLPNPKFPELYTNAEAPAGGWVNPNLTMTKMANPVAKACFKYNSKVVDATNIPIVMAMACPTMELRGCAAGAAVKPYNRVAKAPMGLLYFGEDRTGTRVRQAFGNSKYYYYYYY